MAGPGPDPTKRLDPLEARKLLTWILPHGSVVFSGHARREMEDDDLNEPDVVNILRAGMIADPPDLERGTWRYRVETDRMCAVVGFNWVLAVDLQSRLPTASCSALGRGGLLRLSCLCSIIKVPRSEHHSHPRQPAGAS